MTSFLIAYEQQLRQRVATLSNELEQLRQIFVNECQAPPPPPPPPPPPLLVARSKEVWDFLAEEVGLSADDLKTKIIMGELNGAMLKTYNRLTTQGIRISEEKVPSADEIDTVSEETGISKSQLKRQKYRLTVEQFVKLNEERKKHVEELKSRRVAAGERLKHIAVTEAKRPSYLSEAKQADLAEGSSNEDQKERFAENLQAIENDWKEIDEMVKDLIQDDRKLVSEEDAVAAVELLAEDVDKWMNRYRVYLWLTTVPKDTTVEEVRHDFQLNEDTKVSLSYDPVKYEIALGRMNDALDLLKSRLEEAKRTGRVEDLGGKFRLSPLLDETLTEELHEV